jgi:hypothetical protein
MPEQQEPENTQAQDQTSSIYQPPPPTVAQFLSRVDPNAVPEVRPLTGYLVKVSDIRLRLYLTLEMNNYVEFSTDAVLALQPLAADNALPSMIVLLKREAPVWHNTRTVTRILAKDEVEGGCNVPPLVCAAACFACSSDDDCGAGQHCQNRCCSRSQ